MNATRFLSIKNLGHDIGYHYECLSDSKGNIDNAVRDFKRKLKMFRTICDIKTVSMHGRPLSPYNNLSMWEANGKHKLIKDRFELIREIIKTQFIIISLFKQIIVFN